MRTLFLASTALIMSAGLACAQSAPTTSPAPTGAVSSPSVTPPGDSPGNMGTAAPSSTMSSAAPTMSNGTSSPAPNGAVSAPNVTAAGASPGKMAPNPNSGTAMNGMNATPVSAEPGMGTHAWHHHWKGTSMKLPEDASATTYLHIAKSAIKHRNASLADDALSHAETRLLDRSVPQGAIAADDSPSIQSIESARKALHAGDYMKASDDTKAAASTVSGM